MKFWPYSQILNSPVLDATHRYELAWASLAAGIPHATMRACFQCAEAMPVGNATLAITYDYKGASRFIYLERPTFEEWNRLERGIFVVENGTFGFFVDPLH